MRPDPTNVLVLYTLPRSGAQGGFAASEAGVLEEVRAIEESLRRLGIAHRSIGLRELRDLPAVLGGADENMVFNLIEGFWSNSDDCCFVPTLAQAYHKACSGSSSLGLALSQDKWRSKLLLQGAGLPCPRGIRIPPGEQLESLSFLKGPCIVKPCSADASEGITGASVCSEDVQVIEKAVSEIHQKMNQPALVEQFIDGREINVSVLFNEGEATVLPLAEIEFRGFEQAGLPRVVGYEAKWIEESFQFNNTPRMIPAPLPENIAESIRSLAIQACLALECLDYCRVDFRLDQDLNPYILEVNANPDISPDAGFYAALHAGGVEFDVFVEQCISNALSRLLPDLEQVAHRPSIAANAGGVQIRWCDAADRPAVVKLLADTGYFRPDELEVAKEVLDSAIKDGPQGHYQSYVSEISGIVTGWVCFGPTPCTVGTYDLYWIAVAPEHQGYGFGKHLMQSAETQMQSFGAKLCVVETSSREIYRSTCAFYEKLNYHLEASIPNFYGPRDDKLLYLKAF
jgi:D-alanine-D-alanine ligase